MNLFLGDYSSGKNIDRELFIYETADNPDSALYQLRDYFEHIWNLKDSKDYRCKKTTEKVTECIQALDRQYASLPKQYPEIKSSWDWEALTMETNKVSLLSNPIEANNKEPWN